MKSLSKQGVIGGQTKARFGVDTLSSLSLEKRKEEGKPTARMKHLCLAAQCWPLIQVSATAFPAWQSYHAPFPAEEIEAHRDGGSLL